MTRIGVIHATVNAVEPMNQAFLRLEPEVNVINFVNEDLLFQANNKNRIDEAAMREFAKLLFEAVESGVDGIVVACSIFCPYVPFFKNFVEIPMIAVDSPMIEAAVSEAKKVGIIATTAPSGPSTQKQIETLAEKKGQDIKTQVEIVTEGMDELKKGNIKNHDQIVAKVGEKLVNQGCDAIVLSQITMASAAQEMEKLDANVLTSPEEAVKKIINQLKT